MLKKYINAMARLQINIPQQTSRVLITRSNLTIEMIYKKMVELLFVR